MPAASKVDLYKLHAAEYVAPKRPVLVATKPGRYLTISGSGDPDSPEFGARVGALYAMAWTIKMGKKQQGMDFKVAGLEGLWWQVGGDPSQWMVQQARGGWRWKLLIRIPTFVKPRCLVLASRMLEAKGKGSKLLRAVKLETIREGRCVQMLHVGPYMKEQTTLDAMVAFAGEQGLAFAGHHHEIYLSDPRRVKPAKLRTILRHPVK